MRVDTNTNGHRQWFYFSVKNLNPTVVKFNIYRFKKKFSLFQRGMRPYVLSVKTGKGWIPDCNRVVYKLQKNNMAQVTNQNKSLTYYLTFQYKFEHAEDQVYFAAGLPYTCSFLNKRLQQIKIYPNLQIVVELSTIGKTICGQNIPLLTILPKIKQQNLNFIIINARTHAGETSSSWVLDGLMEKIMKDRKMHKWINQCNVCIKILPMLNPDGVFVGNYRTGIIGVDFNRKFQSGRKQNFPEIHALKKLISQAKKCGKIFLFLDLHGHSVLKNSFIYGPHTQFFVNHPLRNLPFALWHNTKYFKIASCKYEFNKQMTETARVYFEIKQNILSYTCEISLGLYNQGSSTYQMLQNDYQSLGGSIIESISQQLTQQKILKYKQTQKIAPSRIVEFFKESPDKIKLRTPSKSKQPITKIQKKKQKQKQRQTCLEKIKTIRKQVNQQLNERPKFSSVDLKNSTKLLNSKNKILQLQNARAEASNSLIARQKSKNQNRNINKVWIRTPKRDQISLNQIEQSQQLKQQNKEKIEILQQQNQSPTFKAARIQQNRSHREAQFKIRRKSDVFKVLPESIRKKLGPKIELGFSSTKYLVSNNENDFNFERSNSYDNAYLSSQIDDAFKNENNDNQADMQIINQKFSQQYESINDLDSSSDDLGQNERQYLEECIKNNRKIKTNTAQEQNYPTYLQEQTETGEQTGISTTMPININGFKQIRFKSIENPTKSIIPFRSFKRQSLKFREIVHKSLGLKNAIDQDMVSIPHMVQKKQLNERANKKQSREPYFLIQIKNKLN